MVASDFSLRQCSVSGFVILHFVAAGYLTLAVPYCLNGGGIVNVNVSDQEILKFARATPHILHMTLFVCAHVVGR